jgi:hypothetical protein
MGIESSMVTGELEPRRRGADEESHAAGEF